MPPAAPWHGGPICCAPHGMGDLYAAQIVCVSFHWFLVKARQNPFRFEMMHRTPGNPTTVNRVQQPHGMGDLYAAQTSCVGFHWLRVKARQNPFRFEMLHRTPGNPTTVNRVRQPVALF